MGSYKMHMCITEIVRQKFNLSYKFVYGGILPDLIKEKTCDKITPHYLVKQDSGRFIPDINKAILQLDKNMDKEIRLGYIAHLVQDLIWFDKVIPSVAIQKEENQIYFVKTKTMHSNKEFRKTIYEDYRRSGYYAAAITNVDYLALRKKLLCFAKDDFEVEKIKENTTEETSNKIDENIFVTKDILENYITDSVEYVSCVLKKIMGE